MGIAEPHAEDTALGQRVVGADDVVAGAVAALPVVPRIHEHEAVGTVAGAEDGHETAEHGHAQTGEDDPARYPAHPHDGENAHEADGRSTQIGLGAVHERDGGDDEDERAHHGGPALHEPRPPIDDEAHGHQDEGDLAELRGLQPDRPDIEPALGAVMVGASEPHGEDERHGHGPHGPYNRPHPEAVGHDFPQEEGADRARSHI